MRYATVARAGIELVKSAIDSAPVIERIDADRDSALLTGATDTPTSYINGARHNGSWEFEALRERLRFVERKAELSIRIDPHFDV